MKKYFVGLCVFLAACASVPLVYEEPPSVQLDSARVVRSQGTFEPYHVPFQAVSAYDGESVRVIYFSPLGIKLADLAAFSDKTVVYSANKKFPKRALNAFARLARQHLAFDCPPSTGVYKDRLSRGTFEVESTGGVCP